MFQSKAKVEAKLCSVVGIMDRNGALMRIADQISWDYLFGRK